MCLRAPHVANILLLSPSTSLYLWKSAVGSEKENVCTVRHLISVVWNAEEGAKSEILIRNLKIQYNPVSRRIENKRENQFPGFS